MKRKLALVMIVLFVVSFSLVGCNSGNNGAETDDQGSIKIGVFGPTSGEVAAYGKAVVDSVKLAAEEINANGGINGREIEIFDYDTKADKTEAINIYNKLKDQDEVVAIIGGTISGETLAVKELAIADNMPMLTPTATNLDVTVDAPSIFRACYLDPYQGAAAARFTIDTLKAQSVAIIYNSDDAYSEGLATSYKEVFDAEGLTITNYEGYTKNDVDFNAILTEVKDKNPDVIFLPDYYDKVGKIATQIRNIGLDQVCVGVDGWDSVELEYAEQVEGYYFVNHFAKTDPEPVVQDFITAFENKYGSQPNALGALGYDSMYIMAEAINNAGATDNESIVNALAEIQYTGVTGNIEFDDQGDAKQKDIAIIKIVDGKHELIEKIKVD
ncbi:MAG: ABC transporter substrate-binding protein [Eubacteriales bacterium]